MLTHCPYATQSDDEGTSHRAVHSVSQEPRQGVTLLWREKHTQCSRTARARHEKRDITAGTKSPLLSASKVALLQQEKKKGLSAVICYNRREKSRMFATWVSYIDLAEKRQTKIACAAEGINSWSHNYTILPVWETPVTYFCPLAKSL